MYAKQQTIHTKKEAKPISQKHTHTHTHTSERIPGWLQESNPATGICIKTHARKAGYVQFRAR
jgi:hypothetical protein